MYNCAFESRLSFKNGFETETELAIARTLETTDAVSAVFPDARPFLEVGVDTKDLFRFEMNPGRLELGYGWLRDGNQTRRAVLMALLKTRYPYHYGNQFQLEMVTDFLLMSILGESNWTDEATGKKYSLIHDVKFPTMAASFAEYCRSPFRSLAHRMVCNMPDPESMDPQAGVWGSRPLLSSAMWRVYDKLSLGQRLKVQKNIREGVIWPQISDLVDGSAAGQMLWFNRTLHDHMKAMGVEENQDTIAAFKRTMKELQVEAPTHWELTVDLKNTPAWKEILNQLKDRARFRKNERTLVFTPQGNLALPAGLPVLWRVPEISSQKHVMIACRWPKPAETLAIVARHFFAQQNCGKLTQVFWD